MHQENRSMSASGFHSQASADHETAEEVPDLNAIAA